MKLTEFKMNAFRIQKKISQRFNKNCKPLSFSSILRSITLLRSFRTRWPTILCSCLVKINLFFLTIRKKQRIKVMMIYKLWVKRLGLPKWLNRQSKTIQYSLKTHRSKVQILIWMSKVFFQVLIIQTLWCWCKAKQTRKI